MPIQIVMPTLSPTMDKGKLAKWRVKEGQQVKAGDVICEVETDKATIEVEAVDTGKVSKLLIAEGTADVKVNTPIAYLDGEATSMRGGAGALTQRVGLVRPLSTPKSEPGAQQPHPDVVPTALLHNIKHNRVLHAHNVVMNARTATIPRVDDADRVRIEKLSDDFSRVQLTFGYMETPNIPGALALARRQGLKFDIMKTSFFVGRRSIKPAARFSSVTI